MTKKDYIIIARCLNQVYKFYPKEKSIKALIPFLRSEFYSDNNKFDENKFDKTVFNN